MEERFKKTLHCEIILQNVLKIFRVSLLAPNIPYAILSLTIKKILNYVESNSGFVYTNHSSERSLSYSSEFYIKLSP